LKISGNSCPKAGLPDIAPPGEYRLKLTCVFLNY
jgi:hypothetical protein